MGTGFNIKNVLLCGIAGKFCSSPEAQKGKGQKIGKIIRLDLVFITWETYKSFTAFPCKIGVYRHKIVSVTWNQREIRQKRKLAL